MEIDRIDRSILIRLQKNNRIPNLTLAEACRVVASSLFKAGKTPEEEGVIIGDVSIINPELTSNKITTGVCGDGA